jgi:DNA-binding MarR family transcriptional regulator
MAVIDLINGSPEILAESADLSDLLGAVRGIRKWEERHAEVLDHIYRFRTLRLLRSEPDEQALKALLNHLERVTHPRRMEILNGFSKAYGTRWLAYMDLIENRLIALTSPVPKSLLSRAHVKQILDLVSFQEEVSLQKIQTALRIKANNLTRILDLMEANELIERKVYGREKILCLGDTGRRLLVDEADEASRRTSGVQRGASYLRLAK